MHFLLYCSIKYVPCSTLIFFVFKATQFCSLFLSLVLLFIIILVGFHHNLILVLFILVTKPHLISPNFCPCLIWYFPGMTRQSLHSSSALQSVCCSSVLFVMCCLLTLLWIRSENILDQVILQDCWRAAELLQLKRSWEAQNAVEPRNPEFCESEKNYRSHYLYLCSLRTSKAIGSLTLSRFCLLLWQRRP